MQVAARNGILMVSASFFGGNDSFIFWRGLMMSKYLAITAATLLASTTYAVADSNFTLPLAQERDGIAELGRINADSDGVVEIYRLEGDQLGTLLGTEPVHAGTNSDVRVSVAHNQMSNARAVLVVNDEIVATQDIRYHD